ncbi:hypothetical protein GCM10020220_038220 [Nonomuraea rubra]|uniref:SDR family NAD(P)-dependent oxidoreductase n=1 Tax=Nonomuraea rubra TaxID=46180 RepID=UPI0031F14D4C
MLTYRADCGDEGELRAALDAATGALGTPDVVVYNAAIIRPDTLAEANARVQLDAWAVNVVGALITAAHVVPAMARRGGGTFIVTGGMPEPKPAYVSLSLGKAGLRTLVAMLDEEYGASGVHVAGVTVCRGGGAGHGLRSGRHRRALLAAAHPAARGLETGGRPHGHPRVKPGRGLPGAPAGCLPVVRLSAGRRACCAVHRRTTPRRTGAGWWRGLRFGRRRVAGRAAP